MAGHLLETLLPCMMKTPSRRHILRGLAGAGLGLRNPTLSGGNEARTKRRGKKRKKTKESKPNAFGCIDVGKACRRDKSCCSGICRGNADKKTCRAHGAGSCQQDAPGACENGSPATAICNGDCLCFSTTGGSNFCTNSNPGGASCADCKKDADCEALGFPEGSACALFTFGVCANAGCETGRVCLVPCGVDPPPVR